MLGRALTVYTTEQEIPSKCEIYKLKLKRGYPGSTIPWCAITVIEFAFKCKQRDTDDRQPWGGGQKEREGVGVGRPGTPLLSLAHFFADVAKADAEAGHECGARLLLRRDLERDPEEVAQVAQVVDSEGRQLAEAHL